MRVCTCIHTQRSQKKASNPTELEVHEIMRHLTRVPETELGSPRRAASTVNHLARSSTLARVLKVE